MTSFAHFVVGNNKNAFFFCPMRLRSLDSGRLTPYSPLRVLYYLILAALACHAIALATAEPAAGVTPLHLPGFTFYGEAGPMLHIPGLQQKKSGRIFFCAQKVANGDAIHCFEADVRLARGFSGTAAKMPPAPKTSGVLYFVAGCPLIQAQAWHKPSKNPKKTRCGGKPHRARGRTAYS